jgi:hypothetical protein
MRPSDDVFSGNHLRRSAAVYPADGRDHDDRDHVDHGVRRLTKTQHERDLQPMERSRQTEIARALDDSTTPRGYAARGRAGHQNPHKRAQMEQGLGMVVIDYLQLMSGPGKRKENRQQEVSDISRDLKILAKELNVPVIALSQLNREVEHKSPPVPVLSDLRDSGSIEQDADLVMFIYRGDIYEPNTDNGVAKLLVAKQRNGPTGEVRLRFSHTFARFDELADAHQERLAQGIR